MMIFCIKPPARNDRWFFIDVTKEGVVNIKNIVKQKKLEIASLCGLVTTVEDTFEEVMASILENDIIQPDDFVYFRREDGSRLTIRKKDIISVSEYYEEE